MTLRVEIIDGRGSGQLVETTPSGEILVDGFGNLNNRSAFQTMNTTAAFNFFEPISGQHLIITSLALDGPGGATVSIYEAANSSTTTIDRLLFKMNFRNQGQIAIPFSFGGFLSVSEGEFVNAFTDAATVNLNIVGHYHPL